MKLVFFIAIVAVISFRVSDAQVPGSDSVKQPHQSDMSEPNPSESDLQAEDGEDKPIGYFNLKTKTFGGQQFWTDVRYVGGWRIQSNSETKHFRLIDSKDVRYAWGNRLHCNQVLDQAIKDGHAKFSRGSMVIVLHGLIRTSNSMRPLAYHIQEQGGYSTMNFEYASSRNKVDAHAIALKSVIDGLGPNVTEIYLVGHSLGNLVIRRYLADDTDRTANRQGDPRIKRAVMIGPPNQGSKMARLLKTSRLFQTFAGASGTQLSRSWDELERTLATPAFEFGIIAGGQESDGKLSNFVLKGKDDFTVSVEETKLDGAHDFLVRPLFHSTMMNQPDVLKATLSFLKNGFFVSEQKRTPIPRSIDSPSPSNPANRSSR